MDAGILQKFHLQKETTFSRLMVILILILVLTLSHFLSGLLIPFVFAVFFAYLLNPAVGWLEAKRIPRGVAVALPVLALVLTLVLILLMFSGSIQNFLDSTERLKFYEQRLGAMIKSVEQQLRSWGILDPGQKLHLGAGIVSQLQRYGLDILSSTTSLLSSFGLFLLYLLFLLPGMRNFRVKANRAFGVKRARKVNMVNGKIKEQIQQYIKAKVLISLLAGFVVFVLCFVFGIDFPLIWGVLAGLLNFIPNVGSVFSSVLPIILALLQFSSPGLIVVFSVCLIVSLSLIGNLLEPRLMARTLSLSPLVVFVSLMFWGWLWGVIGVILAVPLMAAISIVCQNIPSLRPVAVFLQSAYAVQEDIEKLSLSWHVIKADGMVSPKEEAYIRNELKKEIYDGDTIDKVWDKLRDRPLPLERIFRDKSPEERIQLYQLACTVSLIDDTLRPQNLELLAAIRSREVGAVSSGAAHAVHQLVTLNRDSEAASELRELDPGGSAGATGQEESCLDADEQLAFAELLYGEACLDESRLSTAERYLRRALARYLKLEEQNKVIRCVQGLLVTGNQVDLEAV